MSTTMKEMKQEFEDELRYGEVVEARAKSNNSQIGGNHYKKNKIQTWDFIHESGICFIAGNVIKYVVRYKDKNGLEDLKKARHYLDKLIELEEENE